MKAELLGKSRHGTVWLNAGSGDLDLRHVDVFYHDRLERRARDVLLVERDINPIVADLGRQIGDGTSPVAIVATINRCFARSFDRDAEITLASAASVDHKFRRFIYYSVRQTCTSGSYLFWIGTVHARQSIRLIRYRFTAETNSQEIFAQLGGREIHEVAFADRHHVRLDTVTRGRGYRHLKVRWFARAFRYHEELLQAVHRSRCDMDLVWNFF